MSKALARNILRVIDSLSVDDLSRQLAELDPNGDWAELLGVADLAYARATLRGWCLEALGGDHV